MNLPIGIPFLPMEAKIASEIPVGPLWEYEPFLRISPSSAQITVSNAQ
jgi:hypothetical protein